MDGQDVSQLITQPEPAGYVNQARLWGCICRVALAEPLIMAHSEGCPLHDPLTFRRSPELMALAEEVAARIPSAMSDDEWIDRLVEDLAQFTD